MILLAKTTAGTNHYLTYRLNGITYVPHYVKNCFVGPNYSAFEGVYDNSGNRCFFPDKSREFSAYDLEEAGATKVVEELWTRAKHKAIL